MTRGGRRGHGHANQHGPDRREREAAPSLTPTQQQAVAALVAQVTSVAQRMSDVAAEGREAMVAELAPFTAADEAVALALAYHLGAMRGEGAHEAASVAQALGEAETRREVAREFRRARLRLQSANIHPAIALPAPTRPDVSSATSTTIPFAAQPTDSLEGTAATRATSRQSMLAEAYATLSRESGEMTLYLGWQDDLNPDILTGCALVLDFWQEGARQVVKMQPLSRTQFRRQTVEKLRGEGMATRPITWAEARRLLQSALEVNAWRDVASGESYEEYRPLLEERLLGEPQDDELRHAIEAEERRAAQSGDRPYIATDMEADETIANWLGAWSFGDYGVAYDLLADDAPLRQKATRDEFIAQRRAWADEAEPSAIRLTLIREQAKKGASGLWIPGAPGASAATGKDFEAFWSLVLEESPLSGAVDEVPLATLSSPTTGRHWFWTSYTMQRDRTFGLWVISRLRDEGAASQALPLDELRVRVDEAHTNAEQAAREAPQDLQQAEAVETVRAVTGALNVALHYRDAMLIHTPTDEGAFRLALDDARGVGAHERAAALLEKMVGRFPQSPTVAFDKAIEEYLVAEQYAGQGQEAAAEAWLDRAISSMNVVLASDHTAHNLQALAEMLVRRGHITQAEECLREAIALTPERGLLHADLAGAIMANAAGDNLEGPGANIPRDQLERAAHEALAELRRAAELDTTIPGLQTRIGAIYDVLGLHDDARIAFEDAVQRDPGDSGARYALGTLFLSQNKPSDALPLLETAVEIDPLAVPIRLSLAACYQALRRTSDATKELDILDRIQPDLPQVAEMRAYLASQK